MTDQRAPYVIIRRDGSVARDLSGVAMRFSSRAEAARWLMPGERVGKRGPAELLPGERC